MIRCNARFATLFALLLAPSLSHAAIFTDDFNRADSDNLGTDWAEPFGNVRIASNAVRADQTSTHSRAILPWVTGTAPQLQADVSTVPSTSVHYVGLTSLYADPSKYIYVKVQQQNGNAQFINVGFYTALGIGWDGMTGGVPFFALTTPFSTGRIRTTVSGNTITLDIDRDVNGSWDESHTRGGIPASLLAGTGMGIASYSAGTGQATLDNFSVLAIPEPASLTLLALGSLALLRRQRA